MEPRSWASRSAPPSRPSGSFADSRSAQLRAVVAFARPSDHGQHPEGVREVPRLDRDDRAGKLAFDPCANAVRAPSCPSRCVHCPSLALARSVTRAAFSWFHRRTAAADLVPAQMLARRPPRTTTTTARPGYRALRPHVREPTDSNRTLRGRRGSLPSTLSPASVSPCAAPLCPKQLSPRRAENSMPNISPPSARTRRTARRDQGWVARPIVRARRDTALGGATLLSSHGRPSCLVSQPLTLASFLPAQAGARQLPRAQRAETLAVPTTTLVCIGLLTSAESRPIHATHQCAVPHGHAAAPARAKTHAVPARCPPCM